MDTTKKVVLFWVEILEAEILSKFRSFEKDVLSSDGYDMKLEHRYQSNADESYHFNGEGDCDPTKLISVDIATDKPGLEIGFHFGDRAEVTDHGNEFISEHHQYFVKKYGEIQTWDQAFSLLKSFIEIPSLPTV